MITYRCACDATLFFGNTRCVACDTECGWCDACRRVVSIVEKGGENRCGNSECNAAVFPCRSRTNWSACNALVTIEGNLCRSCATTSILPDLSVADQLNRWRLLEAAKRLLIYDLDTLGIAWETSQPALEFRFPADTAKKHFTTGHQNGVITINLEEADPVAREAARQEFGEPQRTLIGHLRHETAHYLWQTHVAGQDEPACVEVFGDHTDPSYADAMPVYYQNGPPSDWEEGFISAYATSHPWEDFAETTAFYLDMRSVVETIGHYFSIGGPTPLSGSCDELLATYRQAGFGLNEVNRCLGLTDALPEVVSPAVMAKLRYVHGLLSL